jgi:dGTPase
MCHPFDESKIYKSQYATLSRNSKGRKHKLKPDGYRTEFQRDIHRIIYSQPFRRLRHKTQVFFLPNNDHICTRMEHVLHVASASRTVARHLQLNEDLAEAIGLGHDLGHSPFGHHGESVLKGICECKKYNLDISFQHEINGLRVADKLAELDREPNPGLNLT